MRSLAVAVCSVTVAVCGAVAAACSGETAAPATADAGVADATTDVSAPDANDGGIEQDPNVYPADHQPIPVLTNPAKGPVLVNPKIVTITFTDYTRRDSIRVFDDTILTTPWWTAAIGGIGVNAGAGGGSVELTPPWTGTARTTIDDAAVQAILQRGVNDGTIPAPTPGTIYAFYFPKYVTVKLFGSSSCSSFCGYHGDTFVVVPSDDAGVPEAGTSDGGDGGDGGPPPRPGTQAHVAYAVMPDCDPPGCWSSDAFEQITITASHEFAEAASDPFGSSGDDAYRLNTDDAWLNPDLYTVGSSIENGDACSGLNATQGNYTVQRIWSNAAAMKGDQPCQPVPQTAVYFAAAVRTSLLTVSKPFTHKSYGYIPVKLGTTSTAVVNVFSLAALPNDVLLYVGVPKRSQSDASDLDIIPDDISARLSRQTAHNGNGAILSINVPDTASIKDHRIVVRAVLNGDYNDWPVIIHVQR